MSSDSELLRKTSRGKIQTLNFSKKEEKRGNLERLKNLMTLSGWSAADISRRMKGDPKKIAGRISNWLSGENKCPNEFLDALSAKIEMEIVPQDKPSGFLLSETLNGRTAEFLHRITKPIIAFALGGKGAYPEDLEHASPRIIAPCNDPNCYVLALEGDSMEPFYSPGDLLIVAPNRKAESGDLVVVRSMEGEVLFKKLGKAKKGRRQFLSFNLKEEPKYFEEEEIEKMHVVESVIKPLKMHWKAMIIEIPEAT